MKLTSKMYYESNNDNNINKKTTKTLNTKRKWKKWTFTRSKNSKMSSSAKKELPNEINTNLKLKRFVLEKQFAKLV